jgi:hypothetical protein
MEEYRKNREDEPVIECRYRLYKENDKEKTMGFKR